MIRPAHLWVPERRGSYGDEAVDMMALAGRKLDAEQALAVDALLSYGPGGRWVALESGVVEARQNGKSAAIVLPVVLFDLFFLPPDRIVWTAHLFETAQEAFTDVQALIAGCPEFSRRVKKITEANGEEGIELHSGARLDFRARSKGRGRGLGGKRVVMDEALVLAAAVMGALMPTLSAREDPQIMYASSAGKGDSDQLRRIRDRGRAGGDPSLVYVEWKADGEWTDPPCAEGRRCPHTFGTTDCYLDDEDGWQKANPSLGHRISVGYVRGERRALTPAEFGRERLGWFDPASTVTTPVPPEQWKALADQASQVLDPVTLAVEVAFDLESASIGLAGSRSDGLWHVEVPKNQRGTAWLLDAIVKAHEVMDVAQVVIDDKSPAGPLIAKLQELGIEAKVPGPRDICTAYSLWVNGCKPDRRELRHRDQPELTLALGVVGTRNIGDQVTWERKNEHADVTPIVAASLALWGHVSSRPTVSVFESRGFLQL